MFMKISSQLSQSDSTPLWWHYSIDGTPYPPISVTYSRQLIHMDLDVSTIADGLHTLSYFIRTESGYTIDVNSSFFYKVPLGINGINRYDYCFNGDWNNAYQIDTMATDSLRIIKLINVDTFPIRSSNFFFDPNDGTPVIHARNEISFRFWDTEYRFAEKSSQYIDYNVTDSIYADTLERDTTKIIIAPVNNSIHWFKLAAGRGDSLSFKTDRMCTMQLYAPSGEMVFHASGDSVLNWDGCHAWEDGVYYLAVHDAEGTGSIAVSYQWIYRYAVLTWNVHRVGNGGVSTITFEGNGFASLDTVFLIKGLDTIQTLYIDRESNTTMGVFFNFEGADTGMYHAVFLYVDETLNKFNVVSVEDAVPIVLTTTCSYPETFLRGSNVAYSYTITNTGNMTAYSVPLHVFIKTTSRQGITHVKLDGMKLPPLLLNIEMDSIPEPYRQELKEWINEYGDDYYLEKYYSIDSVTGDTSFIRANYSFINIAPFETKTIVLRITAENELDIWLSVPDSVPCIKDELFRVPNLLQLTQSKSTNNGWYCCAFDVLECYLSMKSIEASVASLVLTILDALAAASIIGTELVPEITAVATATSIAACAIDIVTAAINWKKETFCSDNGMSPNSLTEGNLVKNLNLGINTVIDCATGILRISGKKLTEFINNLSTGGDLFNIGVNWQDAAIGPLPPGFGGFIVPTDLLNCGIRVFSKKPNCPPCQGCGGSEGDSGSGNEGNLDIGGGGGTSTPQAPVDPNDIIGYLSESGSNAIHADQQQMPYMIEFENDTAFATAHAHTVIVKDTLDGIVFDLNSFSATAFAIGDNMTTVNGGKSFTRTIDMRPEINVLAQVHLDYHIDSTFGVATWTFTSLNPMTLLPAADSLGFLGIGKTGEVDFTINRKADLPDSTLIDNRAWIVFDNEEPIATSTWRNIIDNTPPMSIIDSITYSSNTATVTINATDNLSGVWRYNVYALMDGDVLLPMAMNVPIDSAAVFTTPDEVVQFRSTAIDSAGNVEPLVLTPLITTVYDTLTITACDHYTWGDSLYTVSGEYTKSKTAMLRNAPDTLSTLFLTVNHSTTASETATACDIFTWHGTAYTTSTNTPTYSTTNAQGCDSTVTLSLTINNSSTNVESVTACDSYTWHGSTYTASTITPTYSTTNAQGCDSTVTLHLTVNNSSTGIDVVNACNSFIWHGTTYTVSTNTPTYTSLNAAGCDSVTTLHLTIYQSLSSIDAITACDSYTWHGTTYTSSTFTPTYSTTSTQGCDSTVTLHLTINYSTTAIENATACDSYTWHGTAYTASTNTPTYSTTNSYGCDSTVTLHLTINNSTTAIETATACDSYTWHDSVYTASTLNSQFSTLNSQGCDSTITLHLIINYSTSAIETATACDSYTWHDSVYTASTLNSQFSTLNSQGCDSTITLHLTINHSTSAIETATACDSYTWHDSVYTASTSDAHFSTLNSAGCDSTVTLHLTINYSTHDTIVDSAVGSYTWHGNTYTESGEYSFESLTEDGCDSVIVLQLTINEVGISTVDSLGHITLYPNPTTGWVTIVHDGVSSVEVFDQSGCCIATFHGTSLFNIKDLPTGVYTLRITYQGGSAVKRIIKH